MARRNRLLCLVFAAVACLLLANCADRLHGAASANGSEHGSAGQVRLGWPF
jgi:hypothetical protein